MKKAVLLVAMMAGISACTVHTSSKNPLPDLTQTGDKGTPNGGTASGRGRASAQTTLAELEGKGALVALRSLSFDMYLSNGNNIGYRRASEIDVGIHGGSYCMFNPANTSSAAVMKIKRVQNGTIASPARNYEGVKISFEDGGSLHVPGSSTSSTVSEIERKCLGSYAEFHSY